MASRFRKIGVVSDDTKSAANALADLSSRYDLIDLNERKVGKTRLDVIIALGGDGFMLRTLHRFVNKGIPIYGMNCGTVGFLMNEFKLQGLMERLSEARPAPIHPLRMVATDANGKQHKKMAFNEVSLLRSSKQAAKIKITVDNVVRMEEMVCDGVLVATPAGSSAYNASAGGPIIPLKVWLLALTPISPFRPRRWRGALLPDKVNIRFDIKYHRKRPVIVVADYSEVDNIVAVEINKDLETEVNLLFDPNHSLEDRILSEQFTS